MIKLNLYLLITVIVLSPISAKAQDITKGYEHLLKPVYKYGVYKTVSSIKIDGQDSEASWQSAKWSEEFVSLKGDIVPEPSSRTRFKMLWDTKYLYFLAEIYEPHIWTYSTNEEGNYFPGNGLAMLVNTDRTTHEFIEFDVNAQNYLNDQFFPKPPRHGGVPRKDWQMFGFKSAVVVYGTLNNPVDTDEKWVVEMAVPFKTLSWKNNFPTPKNLDFWKMNLLRLQWPNNVVNGSYQKKKANPEKKVTREIENYLYANNWVWSPAGIDNVLYPERWGLVKFFNEKISDVKEEFTLPDEEIYGRYLWAIYYRQQDYSRQNGYYATSLSVLGIPQLITIDSGEKVFLKMETRGSTFYATLRNEKGFEIAVNQDGYFEKIEVQNK